MLASRWDGSSIDRDLGAPFNQPIPVVLSAIRKVDSRHDNFPFARDSGGFSGFVSPQFSAIWIPIKEDSRMKSRRWMQNIMIAALALVFTGLIYERVDEWQDNRRFPQAGMYVCSTASTRER